MRVTAEGGGCGGGVPAQRPFGPFGPSFRELSRHEVSDDDGVGETGGRCHAGSPESYHVEAVPFDGGGGGRTCGDRCAVLVQLGNGVRLELKDHGQLTLAAQLIKTLQRPC